MELSTPISNTTKKKQTTHPTPKAPWLSLAFLPILSFIFYYPSVNYDFQFDDVASITKLFTIRHGSFWSIFLNGPRWISYWINAVHYSIGRFNPFTYRLGNIICHTTTSCLLFFFIFYALSGLRKKNFFSEYAYIIAFFTAGLFLLHPVQTQTVSYVIQGQLEGMAGMFIMATSLLFLRACQMAHAPNNILYFAGCYLTAFLACGSKEIAIVTPALLLLVDWFFVAQGNFSDIKRRWLFHTTIGLLVIGMYIYFLKPHFFTQLIGLKMEARNNIGNVLTEKPTDKILPLHFFISQFKVILHYIWIFVWPFNISVEYDWKLVTGFFAFDCWGPLLILLSLCSFVIYLFRQDKINPICFAACWFLITTLPRSSIIPSSELLTDYKTYVPSVSTIFILALFLTHALRAMCCRFEKIRTLFADLRYQQAILALTLIPFGCITYTRNKVWRTAEEFWLDIIHHAPNKPRAWNNYAVALSERGMFSESIPFYERAIKMDKNYPDPLNNLAVAYGAMNNLDKAIEVLQQSIAIQPHYPEAYNNLASFLIRKNNLDHAEKILGIALQLRPHYGKAYFNLGKIAMMRNQLEKAHEYFKSACTKADFDNEMGFKVYGDISMNLHKFDDALIAYEHLYKITQSNDALFGIATAYMYLNRLPEAVHWYEKLTNSSPNEMRAWYNLGEAYVKLARFADAYMCFSRARELPSFPPITPLRQAHCLDQLGRKDEAATCLKQALALEGLPENVRPIVQAMLHQWENKQKG